ncbi:MAG: hypothetical protein A3F43_06695 [Gammaproteobacteria bacterium RIFCSPHIGHO2_12_FULL_42_10]|nr:MAG: hypothetical protein A3F43_06695 [Gammaproteobacteria bacterium RIFCSPHIGHO2_12_FULL_42_10]
MFLTVARNALSDPDVPKQQKGFIGRLLQDQLNMQLTQLQIYLPDHTHLKNKIEAVTQSTHAKHRT